MQYGAGIFAGSVPFVVSGLQGERQNGEAVYIFVLNLRRETHTCMKLNLAIKIIDY